MKKRAPRGSAKLATLLPTLVALRADEVAPPALSTARLVADALLLTKELLPHARALTNVGVRKDALDAMAAAAQGLVEAENALQTARRAAFGAPRHRARTEAMLLRREMTVVARFVLRADPEAQYALDRIQDGDALDDLVGDLRALMLLFDGHRTSLGKLCPRPDAKIRRAAALAATLERMLAETPADASEEARAVDVRDRAATYLVHLVQDLRAAAAYIFRDRPDLLARTRSAYDVPRRGRRPRDRAAVQLTTSPD